MQPDHHSTKVSFICALLCALGSVAVGCSAEDTLAPGKKDGGGGASGAGQAGSSSTTSMSGSSGSGQAGSLGTAGTAAGSGGAGGAAGSGGAGGAGGEDCTSDLDSDGTPDCKDACKFDKEKTKEGICGCGIPDTASGDVNGDGGIDCVGGLFIEAEKGTLVSGDAGALADGGATGPFTIGDDAMAAGGKYLAAPAGFDDGLPGPAHASYEINIPADGNYIIWGRFMNPDRDQNRVWAKVDNGVWQKWRGTTGATWFWYHFHKDGEWDIPIMNQFTKGKHTLELANDTGGVKIDRFYITAQGDKPKGDETQPCNPPHTVQIGNVCVSSCGMLMGNSCDPTACQGKVLLASYDCAVCCQLGGGDAAAE